MSFPLDFTPPPQPPPQPPLLSRHHRIPPSIASLLITTTILLVVAGLSTLIHLLLRRRRRPTPSPTLPPLLPVFARPITVSSTSTAFPSPPPPPPPFAIASPSIAAISKSSPNCVVCLSPFRHLDQLRLLPACRHAFHAACIDTWLRSTPSCPLCRAPALSSNSISVNCRQPEVAESAVASAAESYSLGSSFEYVTEEELEAVVDRLRGRQEKDEKAEGTAAAPGEEVAEAAGGGSRGWLREYVDRISSSSSFRLSGRWSQQSVSTAPASGGDRRRDSWDFEIDESGFGSFHRWLWGA